MDINIWADLSSLWPAGSACKLAGVGVETVGWMEQGSGRTEQHKERHRRWCGKRSGLKTDPLIYCVYDP